VEETTELLEADEEEKIAEEPEEDTAAVELDDTAEEERVRDAEDVETMLERALVDKEGLGVLN
jgi:hypothetical protein